MSFPNGSVILRLGGQLVARRERPRQDEYVAFLGFGDGRIAELTESTIVEIPTWPTDVCDPPLQAPTGDARVVGRTVTGAFIREAREDLGRAGRSQLFLVLDGEALFGLVPTKLGSRLHVEPLLTSPLVRHDHNLLLRDGTSVSIDELVFS